MKPVDDTVDSYVGSVASGLVTLDELADINLHLRYRLRELGEEPFIGTRVTLEDMTTMYIIALRYARQAIQVDWDEIYREFVFVHPESATVAKFGTTPPWDYWDAMIRNKQAARAKP